jgi:hypothetical protein
LKAQEFPLCRRLRRNRREVADFVHDKIRRRDGAACTGTYVEISRSAALNYVIIGDDVARIQDESTADPTCFGARNSHHRIYSAFGAGRY